MALGEPSTENLPRQTHQRGWANAQKHISLLPLARPTCAGLPTMDRTTCSAMTSEQAIELIGSAVDYSKQRSKLLASRERGHLGGDGGERRDGCGSLLLHLAGARTQDPGERRNEPQPDRRRGALRAAGAVRYGVLEVTTRRCFPFLSDRPDPLAR